MIRKLFLLTDIQLISYKPAIDRVTGDILEEKSFSEEVLDFLILYNK